MIIGKGGNEKKNISQLSMMQFTTKKLDKGDTTTRVEEGLNRHIETLLDTASNVSILRDTV